MADGTFKTCPVCKMDRRTTRTGAMAKHNRWDEATRKMVICKGIGQYPK